MKRTWQCPKCGSARIGYIENVPDQSEHGDTRRKIGLAAARSVLGLTAYSYVGEIEEFVCTDCGYLEKYVKHPQSIPWSTMRGFRWCRPEGTGT